MFSVNLTTSSRGLKWQTKTEQLRSWFGILLQRRCWIRSHRWSGWSRWNHSRTMRSCYRRWRWSCCENFTIIAFGTTIACDVNVAISCKTKLLVPPIQSITDHWIQNPSYIIVMICLQQCHKLSIPWNYRSSKFIVMEKEFLQFWHLKLARWDCPVQLISVEMNVPNMPL
jgi:hypothetical protein